VPPIPLPDPELCDGVVRLRQPGHGDVAAITAGCQDPLTQRFTRVPAPYSEENARAFVDERPAELAHGIAIAFVVSPAGGDELLGMCGLQRFDWDHRSGEIGYWIAPHARGRGLAVRAVRLAAPWALRELGLERVQLDAAVGNLASQKVAERSGFTREGVLRSRLLLKGRRWDEAVFSLLPADLEARTTGAATPLIDG
jgi:RimJ/RimL family protein N-acetyltransferase